jgi:hypothetical protein
MLLLFVLLGLGKRQARGLFVDVKRLELSWFYLDPCVRKNLLQHSCDQFSETVDRFKIRTLTQHLDDVGTHRFPA